MALSELWNSHCSALTPNYQQILALAFAVEEINGDPLMTLNATLGFNIYNSRFSAGWTYRVSLELLSTQSKFIPNYKCSAQTIPVAVIGGPTSDIGLPMSSILHVYKIPLVRYKHDERSIMSISFISCPLDVVWLK